MPIDPTTGKSAGFDPTTGRYVEAEEEGSRHRSGECERCHMPTRYRLCAFCVVEPDPTATRRG